MPGNVSIGPNQEYLTSGREYLHSRVEGHVMKKTVVIDKDQTDQGNTLRKGLALGKIASSGKYGTYDNGASDGRETFLGFLDQETDMKDTNGEVADQTRQMVVFGRVKESATFGVDSNAKTDAANGDNACFFIWD